MRSQTTLWALRDAYQTKHFPEDLFDLETGYLETSVENNDDQMPLQFFVDYNDIWWFPLLRTVEVYHTSLDALSNTGAIAFSVRYGYARSVAEIIHGMQFLRFDAEGRISYIRTFANPSFWIDNPHPSVQLDAIGNHIWLGTGYRMAHTVQAAIAFLDGGPEAAKFWDYEPLQQQLADIRKNLVFYQTHQSTQW